MRKAKRKLNLLLERKKKLERKGREIATSYAKKIIKVDEKYISESFAAKDLKQFLQGLTPSDIQDFIADNETSNHNLPHVDQTYPPPMYHIKSSWGDVKERVTSYDLQSYFGGRQLQGFSLLSRLGTGIRSVGNDNKVPQIGKLQA